MPVVLIGPDRRVARINRFATTLLPRDLEGRHFITALRQPDLLDAIESTFAQGQPNSAPYLSSNSATETKYDVLVAPVDRESGRFVLLSFRDITDRDAASQSRRDFVANVSHELRTPLTAMSGFIETLTGAAKDDPEARQRFLSIMSHEVGRMNRLVEDLLSLSRVQATERVRPTEKVNLVETLRTSIARLSNKAQETGVVIEESFPRKTPLIPGDSDQMVQVFTNLLENALRYGGAGGRVRVRVSESDNEPALRAAAVRIDIIDYGVGIDPHDIPRLTERFYRVDDHRSRDMGGTGLGLAIVKHIIGRHRGRLQIASKPGKGSCFSVILPLSDISG